MGRLPKDKIPERRRRRSPDSQDKHLCLSAVTQCSSVGAATAQSEDLSSLHSTETQRCVLVQQSGAVGEKKNNSSGAAFFFFFRPDKMKITAWSSDCSHTHSNAA